MSIPCVSGIFPSGCKGQEGMVETESGEWIHWGQPSGHLDAEGDKMGTSVLSLLRSLGSGKCGGWPPDGFLWTSKSVFRNNTRDNMASPVEPELPIDDYFFKSVALILHRPCFYPELCVSLKCRSDWESYILICEVE